MGCGQARRLVWVDNLYSILRIYLNTCFKVRSPQYALIIYLSLNHVIVYLLFRTAIRKPGNTICRDLKWKRTTYFGAVFLKV